MSVKFSKTGWTLKVPMNVNTLFALYNSLGDVTISAPTQWATDLDGPMKVFRAGALTVNAALTFSNRCRGVVPLLDALVMGASGSISMTGKGAAGSSKWVNQDIVIPTYIVLSGNTTSPQDFFKWLRKTSYFICDPNLFACQPPGMGDVTADYASWPSRGTAIISAAGCAGGGASVVNSNSGYVNSNGGAGSNGGTGGGGSGGAYYNNAVAFAGAGGRGNIWGGGRGGGGMNATDGQGTKFPSFYMNADPYGAAGIAGSGGGGGTDPAGGVLVIICRGNVSLTSGHVLSANGTQSANGWGGSSGGGSVFLSYSGSLTGAANLSAPGGALNMYAAAGGAGSTQTKTFTQMSW